MITYKKLKKLTLLDFMIIELIYKLFYYEIFFNNLIFFLINLNMAEFNYNTLV